MKFFYILPLALLAALGISINSAYYYDSFVNAGYPVIFAYGLSGSFMGLESVIWLYPGKGYYIPVLKVVIIIFSISATLGSQFFSTSELDSVIAETVYIELDTSGNVEYYRDQISILNKRIDEYIDQQLVFGTDRNKAALTEAQAEKANYEEFLNNSQSEKKKTVQKINKPMSIYSFYATRIPEILRGEFGEDFIRVIFQLVSSVILALIAPIALSMIRYTGKAGRSKATPSDEEKQHNKRLADLDKKTILNMLLYHYPKNGIQPPESASKNFQEVNSTNKTIKAYTIEECKKVYEETIKFDGLSKSEIRNEVLK